MQVNSIGSPKLPGSPKSRATERSTEFSYMGATKTIGEKCADFITEDDLSKYPIMNDLKELFLSESFDAEKWKEKGVASNAGYPTQPQSLKADEALTNSQILQTTAYLLFGTVVVVHPNQKLTCNIPLEEFFQEMITAVRKNDGNESFKTYIISLQSKAGPKGDRATANKTTDLSAFHPSFGYNFDLSTPKGDVVKTLLALAPQFHTVSDETLTILSRAFDALTTIDKSSIDELPLFKAHLETPGNVKVSTNNFGKEVTALTKQATNETVRLSVEDSKGNLTHVTASPCLMASQAFGSHSFKTISYILKMEKPLPDMAYGAVKGASARTFVNPSNGKLSAHGHPEHLIIDKDYHPEQASYLFMTIRYDTVKPEIIHDKAGNIVPNDTPIFTNFYLMTEEQVKADYPTNFEALNRI